MTNDVEYSQHYLNMAMNEFRQRKQEQIEFQEIRWMKWKEEQEKAKERASELRRFWLKKKEDQRTAQRDKDFQEAVEKIRRAGYRGKFGEYEVPVEVRMKLDALKLQAEIGDHLESEKQPCVDEWKKLRGMNKADSQRAYIKLANKVLTKYGWNPPTTWT